MRKIKPSKNTRKQPAQLPSDLTIAHRSLTEIGMARSNAAKELLAVRDRIDNWRFQLHDAVHNSIPNPKAVDLQFADVCGKLWMALQALDRIQVCVDYAAPPKSAEAGGAS